MTRDDGHQCWASAGQQPRCPYRRPAACPVPRSAVAPRRWAGPRLLPQPWPYSSFAKSDMTMPECTNGECGSMPSPFSSSACPAWCAGHSISGRRQLRFLRLDDQVGDGCRMRCLALLLVVKLFKLIRRHVGLRWRGVRLQPAMCPATPAIPGETSRIPRWSSPGTARSAA